VKKKKKMETFNVSLGDNGHAGNTIVPVLCVAKNPLRCTEASLLKAKYSWFDEDTMGCGLFEPQNRPNVSESGVGPS